MKDEKKTRADLLAYLSKREDDEATQELLDIPGFLDSFERGRRDIAEGRVTPHENLKNSVILHLLPLDCQIQREWRWGCANPHRA